MLLRITIVVAVTINIYYGFRLRSNNERLVSEIKSIREAVERPLVVRNLDLDMESMLTLLEEGGRRDNNEGDTWRLVLVVADRCPVCERQVPVWEQLLERETLRDRLDIWLISSDEGLTLDPIVATLRERRVLFRRYRVKPASAFSLRTGIGMVPTTIISRGGYVKIVHAGLLTEAMIPQVEQAVLLEGVRTAFHLSSGDPITFEEP